MGEDVTPETPDVTALNRAGVKFIYQVTKEVNGVTRVAEVNCLILDPEEAVSLARFVDATVEG